MLPAGVFGNESCVYLWKSRNRSTVGRRKGGREGRREGGKEEGREGRKKGGRDAVREG